MISALSRRRVCGIAATALLPALAGCGGLLPKPPERQIYRLEPRIALAASVPRVGGQLLVATPGALAGFDTARIPLSRSAVSLDYFADAEWTDRIPFLIQAALIKGFEQSRAFSGVGSESRGLQADVVLETEVRDFAAVYDSPNVPPRVRVQFAAELVSMPGRKIVAETTLEREAKSAADTLPAVVMAFDAAVGGAVEEVVRWTAGNPALSAMRGSATPRTRFVPDGGRGR